MLGAIAGDIIGSIYEFANFKEYDFPLFSDGCSFTDDSVLTVAIADALIHNLDIAQTLKTYALNYPNRGYGGSFNKWMHSNLQAPYNSWGNGSAMRTSAIGFFYNSEADVLAAARKFSEVTHNHSEGIKGAQATSFAIYLARQGSSKEEIRDNITKLFEYDLTHNLDEIRPKYGFDESCQGSMPQAIIAFLESGDFEDAVRKAVSLGGDADTLACITGSIAEAFYGQVPPKIKHEVLKRLPQEFIRIIDKFYLILEE